MIHEVAQSQTRLSDSTNNSVRSAAVGMESVLNTSSPMDGLKALHVQP